MACDDEGEGWWVDGEGGGRGRRRGVGVYGAVAGGENGLRL